MLTVATTSADEISAIVNILGNGFFPIACCGMLFYLLFKFQKTMNDINTNLALMNERLLQLEKKDE